ncbi:uncharacterized protein N7482_006376 [Penicillium canariense]|uniref:Uncharacterized protein n=1 Tax=Penicillium canariense TaxID=189055 RepID=A0A9W9HXR3_9EURO|nr:uncharacterized protein N7482_006376 [Penicillium canariense]KAJ5159372.1 hypothetical protein N7482_006376 [Penicillium canariense]
MSWKAITPGVYERPLGDLEKSMLPAALIHAREVYSREPNLVHTVVDFSIPCEGPQVAVALREGWKALRLLKSPDIATTYQNRQPEGVKQYRAVTAEELEAWAQQTLLELPPGQTVHSAIANMRLLPDWLPFCYLLPKDRAGDGVFHGQLILCISHWRTEATGCLQLLHHLLRFTTDLLPGAESSTYNSLAQHVPGSEVNLLSPSLEEVVMPGERPTSSDAQQRVDADYARFYAAQPSINFASLTPLRGIPSHIRLHQRIYTQQTTNQLLARCKAHAITVSAAIHTAYLAAVWQLADPSTRSRSYAGMMPAQIRSRLAPTSALHDQGAWSPAQQLLITLKAPSKDSNNPAQFVARAQTVRQQYQRVREPDWLYADQRAITAARVHYFASSGGDTSVMPWFSSLGPLDQGLFPAVIGAFRIHNFACWSDFLSAGITLMVWTHDGMLSLQAFWNAAFHADDQIRQTLDVVEGVLGDGLGGGWPRRRSTGLIVSSCRPCTKSMHR